MAARVTVPLLRARKGRDKIVMVTAYDATFARMLEEGGADVLLVGDSVGMVVQGHDTTLPVTLDEMIYHCRAVCRGARIAHIVGDMPFMSYQTSPQLAIESAGRLVKEGGVGSVKLEGGAEMAETIRTIVRAGIPVMAHVGLTPQSVHAMGGFKVQGKGADAERVLEDARAVEAAGAYAVVLEGIPGELAERITDELTIPTIGIGAGPSCDGQVLVCYDLLGLTPDLRPKFVKRYDDLFARGVAATQSFVSEVRDGSFPAREHTFAARAPAATASEPSNDAPVYGSVALPR
ncbi:MAG: 3-methyl-2-oxobutanoate hydroxymethyltransferase [Deltaproteobacteria bacterium]|nr:3-methyl-2-oxobutanoate hydroxymethyltransferase [Deltaproteobacteria bacterium]